MGSDSLPILLLVVLVVVFYLVVLRPARRQQQETAGVQRNLEVGDDVVLSAGIFGTIVAIEEGRVRLEIAPGTVIEVARQVVVRKVEPEDAEADTSRAEADDVEETGPVPLDKPAEPRTDEQKD